MLTQATRRILEKLIPPEMIDARIRALEEFIAEYDVETLVMFATVDSMIANDLAATAQAKQELAQTTTAAGLNKGV